MAKILPHPDTTPNVQKQQQPQQQQASRCRQVALVGSSGGGTATMGHTEPIHFFRTVQQELDKLEEPTHIAWIIFVSLDNGQGMDTASPNTDRATLYYQISDFQTRRRHGRGQRQQQQSQNHHNQLQLFHGTLEQVNEEIQQLDEDLAKDITNHLIVGLICVSCHVELMKHTLQASAQQKIPVTGTGGTSLSMATSTYNIRLVGNAGGSVATTSLTKAISFTHALSKDWNITYYTPWTAGKQKQQEPIDNGNGDNADNGEEKDDYHPPQRQLPTWKSVLNSCLPAFWGVALCKRILIQLLQHDWIPINVVDDVKLLLHGLEAYTLPTICALIMAASRKVGRANTTGDSLSSSSNMLMAVIICSMTCYKSILAGLVAGWLVALLEEYILYFCILRGNIPATMTNLLTTGFTGVMVAIILLPIAPALRIGTEWFRTEFIPQLSTLREEVVEDGNPNHDELVRRTVMGIFGCIFCYGSKIGWYHSIFLPHILIEMELGDASVLGTLDQLTLVMVSAGICAGNLLAMTFLPKVVRQPHHDDNDDDSDDDDDDDDIALMKRGLWINLCCGDFIEVCYPTMEKYYVVNFSGYVASGLSAAFFVNGNCKSSAYLPLPLAIWLADDWQQMTFACFVAWSIPFVATVANHILLHVDAVTTTTTASSSRQSANVVTASKDKDALLEESDEVDDEVVKFMSLPTRRSFVETSEEFLTSQGSLPKIHQD